MASTVSAAPLTVTLIEEVSLNNKTYGNTNSLTIPNIKEVDQRIVNVPTSEVSLLTYAAANAAGTLIRSNIAYMRIVNKDDTNAVQLHITSATDDVYIELGAGKSFQLHNGKVETASAFSAYADITEISAKADGAAVDVEYFIALT